MYNTFEMSIDEIKWPAKCRSCRSRSDPNHIIPRGESALVIRLNLHKRLKAFYCSKHWGEALDEARNVMKEILTRELAGIK